MKAKMLELLQMTKSSSLTKTLLLLFPKELLRTSPDVSLLESVIEIEDDSVDKL
jgi:hypothetical protein